MNNTIVHNTNDSSSFAVNDAVWLKKEVYPPIRGAVQKQIWSVQMSDGARLIEGGGMANYKIVDILKAMFPMYHMSNIVAWISQN